MAKFRKGYEPYTVEDARKYGYVSERPTLTEQSHKRECDINEIMLRADRDGILPNVNRAQMIFEDVSQVDDYKAIQDQLIDANNIFMSFPAKLRKKFNNDPMQFVRFVENPDNLEEMYELGLAIRPKPEPKVPSPGEEDSPKE